MKRKLLLKKEEKIKKSNEEIRKNAMPEISPISRMMIKTKNDQGVVDRLSEYKEKYEKKLMAKRENELKKVTD